MASGEPICSDANSDTTVIPLLDLIASLPHGKRRINIIGTSKRHQELRSLRCHLAATIDDGILLQDNAIRTQSEIAGLQNKLSALTTAHEALTTRHEALKHVKEEMETNIKVMSVDLDNFDALRRENDILEKASCKARELYQETLGENLRLRFAIARSGSLPGRRVSRQASFTENLEPQKLGNRWQGVPLEGSRSDPTQGCGHAGVPTQIRRHVG